METNQTTTPQVNAKKIALTNGLIWTVINIIIFLIVYYSFPTLLANPAFGFVLILVSIGLAVYFTLDIRKKIGGYWSFREAVGNIFLLFFVQVALYMVFTTAFSKWIEPAYADMMRETSLNATTQMMEAFSSDQDAIDEAIEKAEKQIEKQVNPSLMDFIQGLLLMSIFYFIGALIFAAIFKRNPPLFTPVEEE